MEPENVAIQLNVWTRLHMDVGSQNRLIISIGVQCWPVDMDIYVDDFAVR